MLTYEEQLDRDTNWALLEGSKHFERRSKVHKTLQRFTQRLEELGIEYAVSGDLCMFFHGYRRFTEIVEVIVTSEALSQIYRELDGDGYIRPSTAHTYIRDEETGVRIGFRVSGRYLPGGIAGPTALPFPRDVATIIDGIRFIDVAPLIQLKFAMGQASHCLRDLADIQELIHHLNLPQDFAMKLDLSLRCEFHRIWQNAQVAASDDY
jgi:hypothetical protein